MRPEHLELEACVASVLAHLELQGVCFDARVRSPSSSLRFDSSRVRMRRHKAGVANDNPAGRYA